jgi:hypothetical protein
MGSAIQRAAWSVYNPLNPLNIPEIGANLKKTNLNEISLVVLLGKRRPQRGQVALNPRLLQEAWI